MSKYLINNENVNKALLEGAIALGLIPQDLGEVPFTFEPAVNGVILTFGAVSQAPEAPKGKRIARASNTAPVMRQRTPGVPTPEELKAVFKANDVLHPPGMNQTGNWSDDQKIQAKAWAESGPDKESRRPAWLVHRKPRTVSEPPPASHVSNEQAISLGQALGSANDEHAQTAGGAHA